MADQGRRARALLLALAMTAAGLAGCGSPAGGKTVVTVLGPWTGREADDFLAMVNGFEKGHPGITVDYNGTRDSDDVLASALKDGKAPDLAVLATPGELRQDAKSGTILPLDRALSGQPMTREYAPGWRTLMHATGKTGSHYYAIIVKAALKSVIWYDPKRFPQRDLAALRSRGLTWSKLTSLAGGLRSAGASPWCLGLEDSSSSGWPGTDWIEDIVLHRSGPKVYDQWVNGTLPWSSGPIRTAWQIFGQVTNTPGLVHQAHEADLVTNYGKAGQPMFTSPPGCYLDHEASFITPFYAKDQLGSARHANPRPKTDFDFVPFPPLTTAGQGSAEVAGDLLGMFRDSPAAREFIAYLTTPPAQEAWARQQDSGAISVNLRVPLTTYRDRVSRALAADLRGDVNVRFDASDSMPQIMENAFNNAVLEYLDNPRQLTVILHALDRVSQAAYAPER